MPRHPGAGGAQQSRDAPGAPARPSCTLRAPGQGGMRGTSARGSFYFSPVPMGRVRFEDFHSEGSARYSAPGAPRGQVRLGSLPVPRPALLRAPVPVPVPFPGSLPAQPLPGQCLNPAPKPGSHRSPPLPINMPRLPPPLLNPSPSNGLRRSSILSACPATPVPRTSRCRSRCRSRPGDVGGRAAGGTRASAATSPGVAVYRLQGRVQPCAAVWLQAFLGESGKGHGCSPPAPPPPSTAGPAQLSVPLACACPSRGAMERAFTPLECLLPAGTVPPGPPCWPRRAQRGNTAQALCLPRSGSLSAPLGLCLPCLGSVCAPLGLNSGSLQRFGAVLTPSGVPNWRLNPDPSGFHR